MLFNKKKFENNCLNYVTDTTAGTFIKYTGNIKFGCVRKVGSRRRLIMSMVYVVQAGCIVQLW